MLLVHERRQIWGRRRLTMIIRVTIIVIFIVYYCEACTVNTRQMLYVFISLNPIRAWWAWYHYVHLKDTDLETLRKAVNGLSRRLLGWTWIDLGCCPCKSSLKKMRTRATTRYHWSLIKMGKTGRNQSYQMLSRILEWLELSYLAGESIE